jgi:hypothetical protein
VLDGRSFPAYRRIATLVMLQTTLASGPARSFLVDPDDLAASHAADQLRPRPGASLA